MSTIKCPHCGGEHSEEEGVCPVTGKDISPAQAQVGKIVGGKYELIKLLGEGGMGAVYEARHVEIRQKVAVKLLHFQLARDHEIRQRFFREAMAAGEIGHENIIQMHDIGRDVTGAVYLVMEILKGESLAERVIRDGAMPVDRAVDIMLQVLDALDASHRKGIVHRDMKPENIFLCRLGGRDDFVKILDFGIAKVKDPADGESLTRTGTMMGTSHYMAPEQIAGDREADHRIDIYACGVILYQMLVGHVPFDATSVHGVIYKIMNEQPPPLSAQRDGLPAGIEDIIRRAMARDREHRFQAAADLAYALVPYGSGSVVFGRGSQVPVQRPSPGSPGTDHTEVPAPVTGGAVIIPAATPIPAPSVKAAAPTSTPVRKKSGSPIATVMLVLLPLLLIGGIAIVVIAAVGGVAFMKPGKTEAPDPPAHEQASIDHGDLETSVPDASSGPDVEAASSVGPVATETPVPEPAAATLLPEDGVKSVKKQIRQQYQKAWIGLAKKEGLPGKQTTLDLTIAADGSVSESRIVEPALDDKQAKAVSDLVSAWTFSDVTGQGTCTVTLKNSGGSTGGCPCAPNDAKCKMIHCT